MSLADELLADLDDPETEDISNEIKEEEIPDEELMETEESHSVDVDVKVSFLTMMLGQCYWLDRDVTFPSSLETLFSDRKLVNFQVSSIRELCKLHDSKHLTNILKQIDHYIQHPRKPSEMIGNVESDPEYQLIVEANSTAVEIDNEICKSFIILAIAKASIDHIIGSYSGDTQIHEESLPETIP